MRLALLLCLTFATLAAAERINHAGRILGPAPTVTTPVLFNTAAADAIIAAMQIMPRDNPWNEDIRGRPVDASSATIMAQIRSDVVAINSNRNTLRVFTEMNYALVPDSQPLVGIRFLDYPDDSDFNGGTSPVGQYPIPSNWPIEGWPAGRPGESLSHAQTVDDGGDRHAIAVQPGAGRFFETWRAVLTTGSPNWTAANGAIFPLASNALRPDGLTSGDAAGLPMFPALIRYDECERGIIEHALRIVVNKSRKSHIWPATHHASNLTGTQYPPMGLRVRLKSSFTVPGAWTKESQAVARALQTYGALVADNGGFFSVSATPDDRFPAGCFDNVQTIDISNFEVVTSTGPSEGPRSAGAPTASAGADQAVTLAAGATLTGGATGSGTTVLWSLYDPAHAPGTAAFDSTSSLTPHVTFSAAGTYTLLLKVSDGVHTPAYDAVVITVSATSNPVPVLDSISPITRVQNSGGFTLTLHGSSFAGNAHVTWSGHADLPAIAGTSTQFTVAVPASYLATAGAANVAVVNPAPGGGGTTPQIFTVLADTTAPTISAVSVAAITADSATITWTTDEAASSRVDYGTTAAYGSNSASAALGTTHSRSLTGLAAATTYHFQVASTDAAGNPATSADATFTTAAPGSGSGSSAPTGSAGGSCGAGAAGVVVLLVASLGLRARRG